MKALLLENIHPGAIRIFKDAGFKVEAVPQSPAKKVLARMMEDVAVLGIRSKTRIGPDILQRASRLSAIGAFCIGTEQIDLSACNAKGIAVFHAPYSNTRSVVEMALGEMILLLRGVVESSGRLHRGVWTKSATGFHEIRGKRLGIVGYGNIGSQLSQEPHRGEGIRGDEGGGRLPEPEPGVRGRRGGARPPYTKWQGPGGCR
jgi:D-3-phosphoglycerate dehydrogenase